MTQDQKDLLLQDLSGRIPYGVKMNHIADNEYSPNTLIGIAKDMITLEGLGGYECVDVEDYKPYLFPLSSMTEEQNGELKDTLSKISLKLLFDEISSECAESFVIDFYNKKHIDYRGLIPKGLAIDATGLNIY